MVLVLSSFVLLGGGRLIWTLLQVSISAERRSALVHRAANLDLIGDAPPQSERFPHIPGDDHITNSPGVNLRYRLPITQSPALRLVATLTFCLIWNGAALVLAVLAAQSFMSRRPQWFLALFTVPFLWIGVRAISAFIAQMLHRAAIGPTTIELSGHPLLPGRVYRIFVAQAGRMSVRSLSLSLRCDEEATYRQGTDIRTERHRVFDRQIFRLR